MPAFPAPRAAPQTGLYPVSFCPRPSHQACTLHFPPCVLLDCPARPAFQTVLPAPLSIGTTCPSPLLCPWPPLLNPEPPKRAGNHPAPQLVCITVPRPSTKPTTPTQDSMQGGSVSYCQDVVRFWKGLMGPGGSAGAGAAGFGLSNVREGPPQFVGGPCAAGRRGAGRGACAVTEPRSAGKAALSAGAGRQQQRHCGRGPRKRAGRAASTTSGPSGPAHRDRRTR